ncbi:MAG: hypothetical protein JNK00_05210 [Flavipsychrobacter sp.]|nr:hypothetical protein [Flavipsychrobacter sp.]
MLVQKERKKKDTIKLNAPHVLWIALRCCCVEYASGVVSAAHMTVLFGGITFFINNSHSLFIIALPHYHITAL